MKLMYGEKVLVKLLEAYQQDQQNQLACDKYIRENTMSCPHCGVAIQKTMGCNKMTCLTCHTKFCYLCGEVLPLNNPYAHYSFDNPRASTSCRGLLFHGIDENGQLRDGEGRMVGGGGGDPNWWRRQHWDWGVDDEEEEELELDGRLGRQGGGDEEGEEIVFGAGILLGI
jgi:hypothetical protein